MAMIRRRSDIGGDEDRDGNDNSNFKDKMQLVLSEKKGLIRASASFLDGRKMQQNRTK